MVNEILGLVFAFGAGSAAGLIFFGGLWLTVKRIVSAEQPALLMFASMVIRAAIVMVIFYFASAGLLMRIFACLAGFIAVRFAMMRHFEPRPAHRGGQYGTES